MDRLDALAARAPGARMNPPGARMNETSFAQALRLARAAEDAKRAALARDPWWQRVDWRPGDDSAVVERPTEQAALARLHWQTRRWTKTAVAPLPEAPLDPQDTLRRRLARRGQTLLWLDLDLGQLTSEPRPGARAYPVIVVLR